MVLVRIEAETPCYFEDYVRLMKKFRKKDCKKVLEYYDEGPWCWGGYALLQCPHESYLVQYSCPKLKVYKLVPENPENM